LISRVAAIDIGTNTALLTIADVDKIGTISPIFEASQMPRLGTSVDRTRALDKDAVERTLAVLGEYAKVCQEHAVTRLGVTGTSALRDAARADEFLKRARSILGVPVEVASGHREAELTFRGAAVGLNLPGGGRRLVFDVGGGSTEFILGEGDKTLLLAESIDIGSVRLFERSLGHGGAEIDSISAARTQVHLLTAGLSSRYFQEADVLVGVAGTVASLYSLAHLGGAKEPNITHGGRLTLAEVRTVLADLLQMSGEEREQVPCLGRGRADVIGYGATVVLGVLERWAAERGEANPELVVSERGVRYGILRELSEQLAAERNAEGS
jgi:exopolyphosphatase / guanosine-5'-triphosphate,3'-diphosphate pyrophosphatase